MPLKELLPGIESNDFCTLGLSPYGIENDDDLDLEEADRVIKSLGKAIMSNTSIENLNLSYFGRSYHNMTREIDITRYKPLFHGISKNKTIKSINVEYSSVCEGLVIFIGKSITALTFWDCDITVDVFAFVLQRCSLLADFSFERCTFKIDENIRSTKRARLEPCDNGLHVKKLEFKDDTELGKGGCAAVSRFLLNPNVTIKTIYILGIPKQEWDHSFANGLKTCTSLVELRYQTNEEQNVALLSSALPNLTLRRLDLSTNQINVDAARAISNGIKTLEVLILNDIETTDHAMSMMISACIVPTFTLKILDLGGNNTLTDGAMLSLAEALENNSTLEKLGLGGCYSVTSIGWLAVLSALGRSCRSLEVLILRNNSLDDDSIIAFANDSSYNERLEVLDLRNCISVTPAGWRALSRLLGSPHSVLRDLDISLNPSVNDEIVTEYANALRGNEHSQLKSLTIGSALYDFYAETYDYDLSPLTNAIWDPITNLMCNTSSIDATWSSNHTLCDLGYFPDQIPHQDSEDDSEGSYIDEAEMPSEITDLLEMNKEDDKKQVARKKVIRYHFSGDYDLNALIGSNQKSLPRKISWFGRDSLGLSIVYGIIRALPELCQNEK